MHNNRSNLEVCCSICNSSRIKVAYDYKNMRIYKCLSCRVLFQDHRSVDVVQSDNCLEDVYKEAYLESRYKLEEERLTRISSYFRDDLKGLKILEIGSGIGILASLLLNQGADYEGVEPSTFLYKQSLKKFPYLNDKVSNNFFMVENLEKEYFDLIIAVDTLEHVFYPVEFLKQLKTLLRNNGKLYMEVPNESLFLLKALLRKKLRIYYGYPTHPGHVNLFTGQSLKKTLILSGFKLKIMGQLSVLGNRQRMSIISKNSKVWWLKAFCKFFNLTRIDLIFHQGIILSLSVID